MRVLHVEFSRGQSLCETELQANTTHNFLGNFGINIIFILWMNSFFRICYLWYMIFMIQTQNALLDMLLRLSELFWLSLRTLTGCSAQHMWKFDCKLNYLCVLLLLNRRGENVSFFEQINTELLDITTDFNKWSQELFSHCNHKQYCRAQTLNTSQFSLTNKNVTQFNLKGYFSTITLLCTLLLNCLWVHLKTSFERKTNKKISFQ